MPLRCAPLTATSWATAKGTHPHQMIGHIGGEKIPLEPLPAMRSRSKVGVAIILRRRVARPRLVQAVEDGFLVLLKIAVVGQRHS